MQLQKNLLSVANSLARTHKELDFEVGMTALATSFLGLDVDFDLILKGT